MAGPRFYRLRTYISVMEKKVSRVDLSSESYRIMASRIIALENLMSIIHSKGFLSNCHVLGRCSSLLIVSDGKGQFLLEVVVSCLVFAPPSFFPCRCLCCKKTDSRACLVSKPAMDRSSSSSTTPSRAMCPMEERRSTRASHFVQLATNCCTQRLASQESPRQTKPKKQHIGGESSYRYWLEEVFKKAPPPLLISFEQQAIPSWWLCCPSKFQGRIAAGVNCLLTCERPQRMGNLLKCSPECSRGCF